MYEGKRERGRERKRERERRRGISTVTGLAILFYPTPTILVGVCRGLPTYPVDTDFPILLWDLE